MMRWRAAALAVVAAACTGADAPPPNVTFDGARALDYAKIQVDAGPRVPGTEAHRLVGDRIVAVLKANADTVIEQRWTHKTAKGDTIPLRNIFAQFNPAATTRVLYVSHWDSRPNADKSFAEDDRKKPVPGANDGASSTALLLVLAEALKAQPTTVGVDLLFTDGEDYGEFGPPEVDVLLGAKYFAEHLPSADYRPMFGVLWDMIGDRSLAIRKEAFSQERVPEVNDRIWNMAKALGYGAYFLPDVLDVNDDHRPLIAKGIRIADVIDIEFGPHHTVTDTMDKISAQSLEIVGRVALALIRAEEKGK